MSLKSSDEMENHIVGHFRIGPEIGKGSFANVYKGYDLRTRKAVAIKSVFRSRLKNQKLIDNLEVEISILKNLKNPHIVALLDCTRTDEHFHLFMEYCSLGDLSYFIKKRDQLATHHPLIKSILEKYPSPPQSRGMNEVLVINFIQQLASALKFLRSQNLVHRDIKPQNLLLCPPVHSKKEFEEKHYAGLWELPVLKIADFGFARFLPATSMAETLCGSPLYMAPEILRYEKYNAKADLWSVGAVIYEMAVGRPPFRAANHVELLKKIERAKDKISFPSAAKLSEGLVKLICSLLKADPTERMGFTEFFEYPLVVGEIKSDDQPLECSLDDDQLFISEYLPKKGSNLGTTSPLTTLPEEELENSDQNDDVSTNHIKSTVQDENETKIDKKAHTEAIDTNASKPTSDSKSIEFGIQPKDEIIKSIITRNSPPPGKKDASLLQKLHQRTVNTYKIEQPRAISPFEKDYVVVEKRTVEVNALADELNKRGSGAVAISPRNDSFLPADRRYSSGSSSSSASSHRKPSFSERKTPLIMNSTNALSRALGYTSSRLFGIAHHGSPGQRKYSQDFWKYQQLQQQQKAASGAKILESKILNPLLTSALSGNDGNSKQIVKPISPDDSQTISEDKKVVSQLETLATMAHAVSLFAEVKFSQLIPMPPSFRTISSNVSPGSDGSSGTNDSLPSMMIRNISEEGLSLYVKTLSLLAQAMYVASEWWHTNSMDSAASPRMNELVQWIRSKFNECLEKAEYLREKLVNSTDSKDISNGRGQWVVAEKLIFDRALEMSKNAALNEMKNRDLYGCELTYSTAIWMLEALLNNEENVSASKTFDKLDDSDRKTVQGFINVIGKRLLLLRKKIEVQQIKH